MSGSLIKIDEEIVTSAVASVTLGGANWDSSYDVYMVKMNNVISATTGSYTSLIARVLTGGTPQTDANYDWAGKGLWANGTFQNISYANQTYINFSGPGMDNNGTSESLNSVVYLFNFNNASEYSFMTQETTLLTADAQLYGIQGGMVKTTAEANNGVQFYFFSGNIASGTFTLYGLKK
jgi:hypothetical protein